jgi:nucleoside-diphosphate-sugar epimerase
VKKVLVLGGSEFIGGRVLLGLADSGWAQPVADLEGARHVKHARVEARKFNVTDPVSLSLALSDVDAVVNCYSGNPKEINAAAATLFSTAAGCNSPPLIVHISSMSVYGPVAGNVPEDTPLHENMVNVGPYARAKIHAERVASGYERKVVLRPGCEYGPGGELWSGRIAKWLFAGRIGDLGAGGDGYCNLVHIADLVYAVLLSLQHPDAIGKTFNLGMPNPPTWNEYLVTFARALGAVPVKRKTNRSLALESKVFAVPLKVVEIAIRKVRLGFSTSPPIPSSFLSLARQEIRLESARARHVLGWQCRPLDQGIAETAVWYLQTRGRPGVTV